MTPKRRNLNRLLLSSPWITLVLLVTMSVAFPNRVEHGPEGEARKVQIAQAMSDVPLFVGRWVGENTTENVPKEAQQLLRPNAILSRMYQSPGGPGVHVLVVHCGDARDMIGHYPPICYPSSGWVPVVVNPRDTDASLTVRGMELPVREYSFKLLRDQGQVQSIRIFNAFVLPDGTVTREIDDINRMSERLALSVQGVAQVQLITASHVPLSEAVKSSEDILSGMGILLDALGVKKGTNS